ncbi:MAG: hypothetical protein KGY75_09090 [Candidatus Cloacimonetes bacterium]|nr:hypothetical protein [Candidatus Cloacimonadota bacterium]
MDGTSRCKDLIIESGATLTQSSTKRGQSYFRVYGDFDSDAGTFTQTGNAYLYFDGSSNTSWDDDNEDDTYRFVRVEKDYSSNSVNMWQDMTIEENFEVREGIFKIDLNQSWTLTINGTGTNSFEVEYGGKLILSGNQTIDTQGGVQFEDGSQEDVSGGTIKCGRDFEVLANTSYNIAFSGGTVVMNGTADQDIIDGDGGYFDLHDLTIDKDSGVCYVANENLNIDGDLLIQDGIFDPNEHTVYIGNDVDVHGTLRMNNNLDCISIDGDIVWASGSEADITAGSAEIFVEGDWNFSAGANVQMDQGYVEFNGSSLSWIRSYDSDCYFNNLRSHKDGSIVAVSGASTDTLKINGTLYNYANSTIQSYSNYPIALNCSFNNMDGHFEFNNGTFIFSNLADRSTLKPNTGDYFNNLIIDTGASAISLDASYTDTLRIKGDFTLESGYFYPYSFTVEVGGDWTNNAGIGYFGEATSRVVFNGSSHQYVYHNETFNILEVDCDAALRIDDSAYIDHFTVICSTYVWTSGGIDVLSGTFTALDLYASAIEGGFWLNAGGEINLHQDSGSWIDLKGDLHIFGGTMNVYGGSLKSYWPYNHDASIEMSGGILDFHDRGIFVCVSGTYTLTEDITGGTIRTAYGFTGDRSDFTPTGGTIELYGPTDASLSMGDGSNFYNVEIDKTSKEIITKNAKKPEYEIVRNRDGTITRYAKSNTATAGSELDINGDFTIESGIFDPSDTTLYVGGDWTNNVGDAGFVEGSGIVVFDGAGTSDILTQETFYDLHLDKTNSLYYALENGSGDDAGVDVNILNDLKLYDGSFELNNPTNLEIGNIIYIYSGAKLNANDTGTINVYVIEDWKDYNTSDGFDAGSNSVVTFHGGSPGDIHIVRENEYFNDIILNSGTSYMRPSINGDHTIYCKNMDIDNGRLKVAALKIVVDETLNITDELEMTSVDDSLYVGDINWLSSSSDIVTAGKIFVSGDWTFADGTGAELGSGNEVYFIGAPTQFITCLDSDAEFNDLIIDKSDLAAWIDDPSTDTMRVAGDMTVTAGDVFQVSEGDLLIEGILDVENGGALYLEHNGGTMTHNSDFSLNGELNINYGGDALFHGVFEVAGSGNLVIGSGNLICDAPYSKDNKVFNNIYGEINMSDGLFEITNNSLQFASGGHSITGGTIRVGYVFYANNVDVFQPSGGVVEMSSAYAGGSIVCNNLNNNYFHDLVIDDDNPLSTDITINNNLEIITGSLNTNGHDITIGGDWTNNVGDAGFVEGTGTVIFYGGNESDIITDEKFYDLSVDKNNTGWQDVEIMESNLVNVLNDLNINQGNIEMNSSSTLDIDNDLNIALGGGLNANLDTGLNIYVGGDFTNNNTYNDSWNGFWSGSSTITFDGSGNQLISSSCAADTFYNVIIDKADSLFKPTNDTEIFGDLDILNGTWDDNISGLNHNLYGDVHVSTNATWQGLGCTVLFKGDADQTYEYLNSSWYLSDVIVDKTPTKDIIIKNNTEGEVWEFAPEKDNRTQTVTLLSDMMNQGGASLIIEEGTLDLNGNSAGSYGDDIIINDGGKIIVDDNAVLEVGDGDALHVNSGGILEVIGSSGNEATVTKFSVYDNYGFYVNSGGTISAEHAVFEHMNVDGIYIKDGGIIDSLNSFNYCSFSNGEIDPGSCFLKINNAQELTINAANFPDDSSVSYNVIKEEDQGVLTMLDASGDFAGEDYDYDPYNRIDWTSSYLPPVENLTIQYNTGSNEIELIWTYSTTCDSFFIYRDTDPYFTPTTKHAAVSGATTTWSETASGTKYFYIVTAYNEDAAAVMKQ